MIAIENTLISNDILTEYFCCNLNICKGCCCVEGDAGAPLNEDEIRYLEDHLDLIKPYLTAKGRDVIDTIGVFEIAADNSMVTPLVNRAECAYLTIDENGIEAQSANSAKPIAKCAIEKAFEDRKITYQKPISCHLYPIRISRVGDADALNYDRWSICNDARVEGREKAVKVFQFLKEPLIRKYGSDWYEHLVFAEKNLFH
jgi:hypothetical protein